METGIQRIEEDMLGRIYASDEASQVHHKLCSFGSRFAGTPSEKRAVNFILKKLKQYGLTNVHTEEFTYNGWWRGSTKLEVVSPIRRILPAIGLPWSPSTPAEGVEADFLNLGDGMKVDYELQGNQVAGKIVMTSAFSPPWMRSAHRCEKMGRAEKLGAKGFIYMKNDPGMLEETGVATWSCPKEMGRIADFPSVGISRETGAYLARLQKDGPVRVGITMNHKVGPAIGWNVMGDISGGKGNGEMIIVGAHFDGHDISVGAMDDAGGTSVAVEAARVLVKHADELQRTLRFILYPGEEVGCFGSTAYSKQHRKEMDSVRFMLNLDAAGRGNRPGILLQGFPESSIFFKQLGKEMRIPLRIGVSFGLYSDHMPYALEGIETATLPPGDTFRASAGTRGFGHTAADTEDKVDLRDLQESAALVSRIMLRLGTKDTIPMRRRSASEVKAMLNAYALYEVMDVQRGIPSFLQGKPRD